MAEWKSIPPFLSFGDLITEQLFKFLYAEVIKENTKMLPKILSEASLGG